MSRRRVVVTGLGIVSPVGIGVAAAWDAILARALRHRADHALRRVGVPGAHRRRGQGLRRRRSTCPARKRAATTRSSTTASSPTMEAITRRRPRRLRRRQGARRRVHRLGHRRPADDRGDAATPTATAAPRKISPFFVPGLDHQHDLGPRVDPLRLQGPEPRRPVTACTTGQPQHRRGGAPDRVRRRRRHDRRRRRVDGVAARHRRLLRGARAVARATTTRRPRAAPGTSTATASCWARAPACWCSRSYEHAKARGARIYCELAGFGMSADAHHITAPPEDGDGARARMTNALRNAGIDADRHRLHQRARHVDAAGRRRRVHRGQARVRRPRDEARRQSRPSR